MKNKELIKTLVLWLLVASSIALLIIKYNLIDKSSFKVNEIEKYNVENTFFPKNIDIRFSKSNITRIKNKEDYLADIKYNLKKLFNGKRKFYEITKEEFIEEKNDNSLVVLFNDLDLSVLGEYLKIKDGLSADGIGSIKEIVFKLNENLTFFKTQDNFYKAQREENNLFPLVDQVKNTNYVKYYPIFEDLNSDENLIFPIGEIKLEDNLEKKNILLNVNVLDMSRNILGEKLDFSSYFVEKGGSYFYSYQNGKETLKISKEGFIEYKKDTGETRDTSLLDAYNIVFSFLNNIRVDFGNLKVVSCEKIIYQEKDAYKFKLCCNLNFNLKTSRNLDDIMLIVSNKDIAFARISLTGYKVENNQDKYFILREPSDILSEHIDFIKNTFSFKSNDEIIKSLKDYDIIYIADEKTNSFMPAVKFIFKNFELIVNEKTGEIISYEFV